MKKETKIFMLIIVISVAVLTALDIQTKGKITSLLGSVNPMNLKSSDVPYTNNSQSTVQGAIDNLYTKAKSCMNSSDVELFDSEKSILQTDKFGVVYATSMGVCAQYKGKVGCFKINNYDVEKNHIKEFFYDEFCPDDSGMIMCYGSNISCSVYSDGGVSCNTYSASGCSVESNGEVRCN